MAPVFIQGRTFHYPYGSGIPEGKGPQGQQEVPNQTTKEQCSRISTQPKTLAEHGTFDKWPKKIKVLINQGPPRKSSRRIRFSISPVLRCHYAKIQS